MNEQDIVIKWPPPWFGEGVAVCAVYVAIVVTFVAACILLRRRSPDFAAGVLSSSLGLSQISLLQHIWDSGITCGCGALGHERLVVIGYGRDYLLFLAMTAIQGVGFCVVARLTGNRIRGFRLQPFCPAFIGFVAATTSLVACALTECQYVLNRALLH